MYLHKLIFQHENVFLGRNHSQHVTIDQMIVETFRNFRNISERKAISFVKMLISRSRYGNNTSFLTLSWKHPGEEFISPRLTFLIYELMKRKTWALPKIDNLIPQNKADNGQL